MTERRTSPRRNLGLSPGSLRTNNINYGPCPSKPVNHPTHFHTPGAPNTPIKNCPNAARKQPLTPTYTDTIQFSPSDWTSRPKRPWNIPSCTADGTSTWPPTATAHLLTADFSPHYLPSKESQNILKKGGSHTKSALPCLGKYCWQTEIWSTGAGNGEEEKIFCPPSYANEDADCGHTLQEWMLGCADWESRFVLRRVPGMGFGVQSLVRWEKNDILGAYTGKLLPSRPLNTDYTHEMHIGPEFALRECETGYLDAEECGNCTRFVNHSCANNAVFVEARVGRERVLALVATGRIEAGEDVCVDYQDDYFSNGRACGCGERACRYRGRDAYVDTAPASPTKQTVPSIHVLTPRKKRKVVGVEGEGKGDGKFKTVGMQSTGEAGQMSNKLKGKE